MRTAAALLALGVAYVGCLALVKTVRRRTVGLAAPLALSVLICAEALLLRALSPWKEITPLPVAAGNLAIGLVGILVALGRGGRVVRRWGGARPSRAAAVRLGLFALLAVVALTYRPNNWDSMTYHMARVAHWMAHRSVELYPTNSPRQVLLPPGAEYLILSLQVVAGSDRLANLVQLAAWWIIAGAAAPLARCFGARRRVAVAGSLVVAAAPMALLQATSTQNDLVSAAAAIAIAVATLPLLHRTARWRSVDLVLLAIAGGAGLLVKPTALVFTAPLLAVGSIALLRSSPTAPRPRLAGGAMVVVLGAAALVPLARAAHGGTEAVSQFVYAGAEAPLDRAANAIRGAARNLRLPEVLAVPLTPAETVGCNRPASLCLDYNAWPHEDSAGNPVVAYLVLAVAASAAVTWRRLGTRARLGCVALAGGWALFHALFRDNTWITRLQLPAVALVPLALGAVPSWWDRRAGARAVLGALSAVAVVHGVWVTVHNTRRPLRLLAMRRGASEEGYYPPDAPAGVAQWHSDVLGALSRSGCRQLAIYNGGETFDYPISWRAMLRGIDVRPAVAAAAPWGCALVSDIGPPPPRGEGRRWVPSEVPGLYVAEEERADDVQPVGAAR